jgi:hypothetical protein
VFVLPNGVEWVEVVVMAVPDRVLNIALGGRRRRFEGDEEVSGDVRLGVGVEWVEMERFGGVEGG